MMIITIHIKECLRRIEFKMNNVTKVVIIVFLCAYILSPIDLVPGCPIDDLIITLAGVAAMQKGKIIKANN